MWLKLIFLSPCYQTESQKKKKLTYKKQNKPQQNFEIFCKIDIWISGICILSDRDRGNVIFKSEAFIYWVLLDRVNIFFFNFFHSTCQVIGFHMVFVYIFYFDWLPSFCFPPSPCSFFLWCNLSPPVLICLPSAESIVFLVPLPLKPLLV